MRLHDPEFDPEELAKRVRETMGPGGHVFRLYAHYHKELDLLTVQTKDCSFTQRWQLASNLDLLEDNHPEEGQDPCVGFIIEQAFGFCLLYGVSQDANVDISLLLDAIEKNQPHAK